MTPDRYLRFDACHDPRGGRPILWPVRVCKVLYPTKRSLQLNLFQQAILGLARARCQDRVEMAELLGLDQELVAFIIASQLIPNGWMTNLAAITSKGERVLDDALDDSEEVRMGYAYQDSISGSWLPRFTEDLAEIEPNSINSRGYPAFLVNRNSGKEYRPFRLNHLKESALDTGALFDAFKRYRTDHDHARQRDDELPTRVRIESISFVENSAQPMWLWTWIYPDKAGQHPWLVADPFGLQRAASWLRKPLKAVLPRNDGLAKYIVNAIGTTRTNDSSAEEWLQSLESQIDVMLLADYSWSRKVPLVEGYLASVLRRRLSLEGQERSLPEDATSLLIETHNLTESVLQWLLKTYPADIKRLPHRKNQRDWKKGEAQHYLQSLNLSCLTDDVIKRLSYQSLNQVRNAVEGGGSSPKALLFAGLLGTVDQENHPFHSLAADELQLSRLLDMADDRNKKAGHSGGERIDRDSAMDYADFVIEWVQVFKGWY